jgi:Ca2+:H+ antiporter
VQRESLYDANIIQVGFVLVPLLSNVAEGATAITVAVNDKMDLSIGVCVGTSTQITLFVYPFLVTMGWMAGLTEHPLLFDFDGFQSVALFGSGLIPYLLIRDGKSDW